MNLEDYARSLLAQPSRARSLIVTFFGDVVSVQPARAWLGSLISVMGNLELSEHLVRTACNRLAREGWLQSLRLGRRSYYHFSDYGARQYRRAAYRIYAPRKPEWDGYWDGGADTRPSMRRAGLNWNGNSAGWGLAGPGRIPWCGPVSAKTTGRSPQNSVWKCPYSAHRPETWARRNSNCAARPGRSIH